LRRLRLALALRTTGARTCSASFTVALSVHHGFQGKLRDMSRNSQPRPAASGNSPRNEPLQENPLLGPLREVIDT
jgi:hypothetical protein